MRALLSAASPREGISCLALLRPSRGHLPLPHHPLPLTAAHLRHPYASSVPHATHAETFSCSLGASALTPPPPPLPCAAPPAPPLLPHQVMADLPDKTRTRVLLPIDQQVLQAKLGPIKAAMKARGWAEAAPDLPLLCLPPPAACSPCCAVQLRSLPAATATMRQQWTPSI